MQPKTRLHRLLVVVQGPYGKSWGGVYGRNAIDSGEASLALHQVKGNSGKGERLRCVVVGQILAS